MSHFKPKMHQNRSRLRFCPDPVGAGRACSAPADPLVGFKGHTSKAGSGGEGTGKPRPHFYDEVYAYGFVASLINYTLQEEIKQSSSIDRGTVEGTGE